TADRIVAGNVVERAHLVWYYGATAEGISVIPCGVDTELFQPMSQAAAKDLLELPPQPALLYVGRLEPIKGLETLLEAMARIGGAARLYIVGGDTGYVVPEGVAGALSERLELLLHDPETRARLGREATRWAADHRWPCVAEAVCRLYSELRPQALSHLSRGRCQS